MMMPIAIGLVGRDGGDIVLKSDGARSEELASGVFVLDGPDRAIVFRDVASKPALSFLRGFSAPVRVDDDILEDELIVLSRHDSDRFNRWQSMQSLATRILIRGVAAIRTGGAPERNDAFIAAYGGVLEDARAGRIDPAFAALAMGLPSEADIARDIGENVNPSAIFAARDQLRGRLGRAHRAILADLHDHLADSSPFSPTAAHAGRRALRNGALAMLAAGDAIEGVARAEAQLAKANNMTETFGAMSALALVPGAEREKAIESFGRRFAAEPLILDKWFALQAQIPEAGTLDRVRGLMRHHAFSLANPNRVRSLIGGFAANQTQFNRADGGGYQLLEEIVVKLDASNPQVAARLLTMMRSWRSLEEGRRALAESALRRVAAQPSLSPDLRDIVTRSLA
jgi:aminopeptidase N